jgi:O-antigen ligase
MSALRVSARKGLAPLYAGIAGAGGFLFGAVFAIRPLLGAIGVGALVFIPLLAMSLPIGIAIWVVSLFLILGLATTVMQLLIAAGWIGAVIAKPSVLRQVLLGQRVLVGALALLMAWLCLSSLWADDPEVAWHELRWWLVAGAALIVVATSMGSARHVRLIMLALITGALLSALLGVVHPESAPVATPDLPAPHHSSRLAGYIDNPNDLAGQLVPSIVFAIALFADAGRRVARAALITALIGLTVALAATESWGGFLAAAVVVLGAAILRPHLRRRVLLGMALVASLGGIWLATSPSARSRVVSLADGGAGRSTLWLVAWRMSEDYAPEGVGLSNYRILAPYYVGTPGALRYVEQIDSGHNVHNTYLQLLAETGPVGLSLFLVVVMACLAAAQRAGAAFARVGRTDLTRLSQAALLAGLAVLTVTGVEGDGFQVRFWVVLALGPALLTIASHMLARSPDAASNAN